MCGRYALYGPHSRYRDDFGVSDWPDFADHYNIAPSLSVPVIRQAPDGRLSADLLRWGLVPHWAKDAAVGSKLNNARSETIAEKPSFRAAYRQRRCLVPACGFYEWQAVAGARKQPWFIRLRGNRVMAMAGIWESWRTPEGGLLRSFCVITTSANGVMAPIHDRMPVIVAPADRAAWLDPATDVAQLAPLMHPAVDAELEAWPVSRAVSSAGRNEPQLVQPDADAMPQVLK
jgi:putative SOS response-associated peptidase YedK